MTRVNVDIDNDVHKAFKIVSAMKGLKVKDALKQAMIEFIETHHSTDVQLDIKVIKNNKKNLLTFVFEEQIKGLVTSLIEAKKRNAPRDYIQKLKNQALDLIKKHPEISEDLATEILQAFKMCSK
ncbi:MAG: hypothetical protein OEY22_01695 [Candidatus Bathyarchaeota archaeon]|nr:hypothetical protein [Candidatus Bathyarchaeota archaeon]